MLTVFLFGKICTKIDEKYLNWCFYSSSAMQRDGQFLVSFICVSCFRFGNFPCSFFLYLLVCCLLFGERDKQKRRAKHKTSK